MTDHTELIAELRDVHRRFNPDAIGTTCVHAAAVIEDINQPAIRTEHWTKDGQTAIFYVDQYERTEITYDLLAQMLADFGFVMQNPYPAREDAE